MAKSEGEYLEIKSGVGGGSTKMLIAALPSTSLLPILAERSNDSLQDERVVSEFSRCFKTHSHLALTSRVSRRRKEIQ